jgi:hypothetical protein
MTASAPPLPSAKPARDDAPLWSRTLRRWVVYRASSDLEPAFVNYVTQRQFEARSALRAPDDQLLGYVRLRAQVRNVALYTSGGGAS